MVIWSLAKRRFKIALPFRKNTYKVKTPNTAEPYRQQLHRTEVSESCIAENTSLLPLKGLCKQTNKRKQQLINKHFFPHVRNFENAKLKRAVCCVSDHM